MKPVKGGLTAGSAVKLLFYTLVFDTIIALFLTAIKFGGGFWINFFFSQSIGLSCCTCVMAALHFFPGDKPLLQAMRVALALVIGSLGGSFLGATASGIGAAALFDKHGLLQLLTLGVMFGSIITYFFSSREQIAASREQLQEEKIKRLTSEKKAAEANLKQLQAQIEPHFLFNTLSNVLNLLDTDVDKGKSMLVDFTRYLRTSLVRTRGRRTTLGQELDMIRAYLNIYKVRMEDRLKFSLELPDHLKDVAFPPMLLQPLVENAIKHGLEPKVEGGEILVTVEEENGRLRLAVADTGMGIRGDYHSGLGLANVRERLESLYGSRARFILEENLPCGVKATLEVPHASS
ncbi:MAG: sensor histidine kinase [Deltaproteobacteria bacterium]|jgi:sensor histidine kinase YesM|nr:sensor histidine kinase [Deltaproteobacteria bacterium]MBW2479892.1 sensor histidine kinase [Deltaproteobacteria bacterium]